MRIFLTKNKNLAFVAQVTLLGRPEPTQKGSDTDHSDRRSQE